MLLVCEGGNEGNDPAQDQFGEERLLEVCAQGGSDLVQRCKDAVTRFAAGAEPNDDVTILLLSHGGCVG